MIATHISQKQQWLRSHTNRVSEMLAHFNEYRVVSSSGIKDGSCCAVVLRAGGRQPVYGNSQAHKLDMDQIALGQAHAEVVAFELSEIRERVPPSLIFCELSPCPGCQKRFQDTRVEIVYLFDYATGRDDWRRFHRESLETQIEFFRRQAGLAGQRDRM